VRLRARVSSEQGFGLVELLISMIMLNVAILALVAAFQSGAVALQRAGKLSTAAALADIQMEKYRALKYEVIALDTNSVNAVPGTDVYRSDAAYSASQVTTTCTGAPLPNECLPTRELLGPDNKRYRVDTYIVNDSVATSRMMKRVTIVVRDGSAPEKTLARVASTFDQATGS
jgi:Tfp pilus assembly protein PilE